MNGQSKNNLVKIIDFESIIYSKNTIQTLKPKNQKTKNFQS